MLLKLTCAPHPDIANGQALPCYVDASRILLITRGMYGAGKESVAAEHRLLVEQLWEEVERVVKEAQHGLNLVPENELEARATQRCIDLREAAASLQTAYGMVARVSAQPGYHPRIECTEISLACGTALEHGVMLSRVWVTETPEEVREKMEPARPTPTVGAPIQTVRGDHGY